MTDSTSITMGYDDGDIDTNASTGGNSLNALIDRRYSRRAALLGGTKAAAFAVFGGAVLAACGEDESKDAGPTITAGSSGETSSGRVVTLTGSTSNTAGTAQGAFSQVSGPPVALTQGATGTTFIAPSVAAATMLVFRYTATDSKGLTFSTDTSVSITPATLGFAAVSKNKLDVVTVPAGYTVSVLYRLGDPIDAATPAYKNDGTDTSYATRAGDHGDALHWFGLAAAGSTRDDTSSTRGLLVMNHENINQPYLHVGGATNAGGVRPEAEALKEMECHGLSVVEVTRSSAGAWSYVQAGALNRRITPLTPTVFNGPVKGSNLLKTAFSPTGVAGRGTINNCANGYTPWATNLTCEENWAGYFRRPTATDNALRTPREVVALTRFGVTSASGNYGWSTVVPADSTNTLYRRWDARVSGATATDDFRNEPYQFGWVVEIDPYDKASVPRKRTALGRFNHEGCWPSNFVVGRKPAWYMGDDAQNEYLYKFVSATPWAEADATAADRLSIGDKYLDNGTLYVAKFNADGSGSWSPLTFGSGPLTAGNATYAFADQADVLANARLAGDALGATKMDRPEWTAVNPVSGEVYLTLTNNSSRTAANTDAANPRAYLDPPSTSVSNRNGHIIRLRETGDTSEALAFAWDIYAFGAGSDLDPTNINLSGLDATNDFSSPDGLWFGRSSNASGKVTPVLWIQTDDSAYTDVTNCMMLAAMPGPVNDGGVKTVTNAGRTQATRVGKAPGTTLRRFLVGPIEAEITGVDSTPDGKTLFVNIQHPGENGNPSNITSHWPDTQATGTAAATIRPRSATVVITKNDGGVVAL
ncbi:PhoX family protein [Sphingomonas echinoides]|uniref:PhoX family protein n=1 Tax=Sphingomonas echinoides TaxID=59803 RepID=UPI00241363E7|nr:alkaline phosphatase PhoX [Sphingomonas echinoides]